LKQCSRCQARNAGCGLSDGRFGPRPADRKRERAPAGRPKPSRADARRPAFEGVNKRVRERPARLVDHRIDARTVVHLPRDQDAEIVVEANEPAIEHPVRGARQGDAVLDAVGPAMLDRLDVRRLCHKKIMH